MQHYWTQKNVKKKNQNLTCPFFGFLGKETENRMVLDGGLIFYTNTLFKDEKKRFAIYFKISNYNDAQEQRRNQRDTGPKTLICNCQLLGFKLQIFCLIQKNVKGHLVSDS